MGVKDRNYQVIYRGQTLEYYNPGQWVFFQRAKEYGGGFWFGRTYDDCFLLEFHTPTSLAIGLEYIITADKNERQFMNFDDDFHLEG